MKRKFFIGSIGAPGEGYDDENWKRCIEGKAHVMHQNTKQKGVFNDVKKGSVFFLKYKDNLIAYGEVSTTNNPQDGSSDGWNMRVNVNEWFFFSEDKKKGVGNYRVQENTLKGAQMATIKEVTSSFGLQKMEEIDKTTKLYRIIENELNMKETTLLLTTNHNLILTGAPGTGKTYLAKQIAQQLIFGEVKENLTDDEQKQFDEQCGFVQFHPSYDYTDFVEGLRPIQDENGNVGFERKDGVFKKFCRRALEKNTNGGVDNFKESWNNLIGKLSDEGKMNIPFIKKNDFFEISLNQTGTGLMHTGIDGGYFSENQIYNVYRDRNGVPSGAFDNYRKAIVAKMKSDFGLKNYEVGKESEEKKKYVFIIDEINRGEISKIFGELFFSIDPGYRGEKVQTQYQNLVEEDDEFKNGFFVPENVYIIGTMNDIDRSVESMDFAFRRRFAFKEIKANKNVGMLDSLGDALKEKALTRMEYLNEAIEKIEGLSFAYHIGASYFLKLNNYEGSDDDKFNALWDYHIEGLLRECLRGMTDVEVKIGELKKAFENESTENNG